MSSTSSNLNSSNVFDSMIEGKKMIEKPIFIFWVQQTMTPKP